MIMKNSKQRMEAIKPKDIDTSSSGMKDQPNFFSGLIGLITGNTQKFERTYAEDRYEDEYKDDVRIAE